MKNCPFCGGSNEDAATVCALCKRELPRIQAEPSGTTDRTRIPSILIIVMVLILILLIGVMLLRNGSRSGSSDNVITSDSWRCTEYSGQLRVVFIRDEADVYNGVDEPSTYSVKGHVSGGAGGVEARCYHRDYGTYYRLRGVDWWGWVSAGDTKD
jgi:hypothetical protein